MSLRSDDIHRIARLARIQISPAEAEQALQQLNGIFSLVARMQAADTAGVEPMAHARDVFQRLRTDTVTETDRRATFQAIAPQAETGLYLVPRVVE